MRNEHVRLRFAVAIATVVFLTTTACSGTARPQSEGSGGTSAQATPVQTVNPSVTPSPSRGEPALFASVATLPPHYRAWLGADRVVTVDSKETWRVFDWTGTQLASAATPSDEPTCRATVVQAANGHQRVITITSRATPAAGINKATRTWIVNAYDENLNKLWSKPMAGPAGAPGCGGDGFQPLETNPQGTWGLLPGIVVNLADGTAYSFQRDGKPIDPAWDNEGPRVSLFGRYIQRTGYDSKRASETGTHWPVAQFLDPAKDFQQVKMVTSANDEEVLTISVLDQTSNDVVRVQQDPHHYVAVVSTKQGVKVKRVDLDAITVKDLSVLSSRCPGTESLLDPKQGILITRGSITDLTAAYNINTGEQTWQHQARACGLHDGQLLVVANNQLAVLDTQTGRQLAYSTRYKKCPTTTYGEYGLFDRELVRVFGDHSTRATNHTTPPTMDSSFVYTLRSGGVSTYVGSLQGRYEATVTRVYAQGDTVHVAFTATGSTDLRRPEEACLVVTGANGVEMRRARATDLQREELGFYSGEWIFEAGAPGSYSIRYSCQTDYSDAALGAVAER